MPGAGPYPPAHRRLQFTGTLAQATDGGNEIFDFGFADKSALSLHAIATAALARMQTAWTDPNHSISFYATLVGVRVEDVAADGKVTDSYYLEGTKPNGSATGATVTVLSHCVTLETQTDTGKGRMVRGRFYPPAYMSVKGATALLSDIDQYALAWAATLNGMVQDGLVPAVASVTAGGQIAQVTAVSAATVIDTVRRRRNHVTVQRSPKASITS